MIQRHALGNMIEGENELKSIPIPTMNKRDDQTSLGEISSIDSPGELSQDIDASISRAQEVVRNAKNKSKKFSQDNGSEKGSMLQAEQDLSLSSVSDRSNESDPSFTLSPLKNT
jgi:hypothetical protein